MSESKTINIFSYTAESGKLVLQGIGERSFSSLLKNKILLESSDENKQIMKRIEENEEIHIFDHKKKTKVKTDLGAFSDLITVNESKEALYEELKQNYPHLLKGL